MIPLTDGTRLDGLWSPSTLDIEPEQCWCLSCGDELPCGCAERALAAEALSGERLA